MQLMQLNILRNIFACCNFADIFSLKGQPTSAKGLGVPEDGGQEGELVEQAQGLPLHRGEGYGLLLHLWGVLGGGGAEVPQVEIYLKNAIFCSKNYFRP